MTWQSVYHPSKPYASMDRFLCMCTNIVTVQLWYMHWSKLVIELSQHKQETKMTNLCVWCKSGEEKSSSIKKQEQPNNKFIYDFCLTCLEASLLFTLSQLHGNFPRMTITVFTYRSHHPVPQRNEWKCWKWQCAHKITISQSRAEQSRERKCTA